MSEAELRGSSSHSATEKSTPSAGAFEEGAPSSAAHRGEGAYGIRLESGEVQLLTESAALTNKQADGLLGGGAELVWVEADGRTKRLDILQELDGKEHPT